MNKKKFGFREEGGEKWWKHQRPPRPLSYYFSSKSGFYPFPWMMMWQPRQINMLSPSSLLALLSDFGGRKPLRVWTRMPGIMPEWRIRSTEEGIGWKQHYQILSGYFYSWCFQWYYYISTMQMKNQAQDHPYFPLNYLSKEINLLSLNKGKCV